MKKIVTFAAFILAVSSLHAQDAAGVAMPFSVIPRTVSSLSTGATGAFDDASLRVFGEEKFDASLSWYSWAPSSTASNNINADIFAKLGQRLGLTAQFALDNGQKYDIYNSTGTKGGFYVPKDMMIKLGASFRILPSLSAGATLRYMSSSLTAKNTYSAFAADVMAAYELGSAHFAAGVTSLGTPVKSADGTSFGLPAAATLAGNYALSFAEKHAVDFRLQGDWFFKGGLCARVGAEYAFADMVFARLGYCYGGNSPMPSFLSVGLGAKFAGVSISAAYLLGSQTVGGTLAIGAGYSF